MYTLYQLVSRIPLPTSLTLGTFPPGEGLWDGKISPLQPDKWQFVRKNMLMYRTEPNGPVLTKRKERKASGLIQTEK